MLIVALLAMLSHAQQEPPTELPLFINFEQPITQYITPRFPNQSNSTHNCMIVPCTVVDYQQNCMVINKLTYGGDCFSKYFTNPVNLTSVKDVLTVEFAFFINHHPQSTKQNSGLVVGWESVDQFYWAVSEEPSKVVGGKQSINDTVQFVEINGLSENIWTTVRFHIHSSKPDPIRLVFEAYSDIADYAGQFLITNISIFHRGECSTNCLTCQSFYECTSCDATRLYRGACLTDVCYHDATSQFQTEKFSIGWINQVSQVYGVIIKNIRISECYDVEFIFNNYNKQYINGSTPSLSIYQYGFNINENSIKTAGCPYYDTLPKSKQSGYICKFLFKISLKDTMVKIIEMNWEQEFYYDPSGQVSTLIDPSLLTTIALTERAGSVGEVSLKVDGKVLMCKDSSCRSFDNEQTLYLNQNFYLLVMLNGASEAFGADFIFNLTGAYAIGGSGITKIELEKVSQREKNMTATIFGFRVPIVVEDCVIMFSANLIERPYEEIGSRRRLLSRILQTYTSDTEDTQVAKSSEFGVSGSIKVAKISILPGWTVNGKKDVPYIILGVAGFAVLAVIILYWVYLCLGKLRKTINNEASMNFVLTEINDSRLVNQINGLFNPQN